MTHIYHITSRPEWEAQKNASVYRAPSLESEGFIHSSRADQIVDTANGIFAGRDDLVILVIDAGRLTSPLKEEDSYGHGFFPHVYGPIDKDAIIDVLAFPPLADGSFKLPGEIQQTGMGAAQ